MEKERKVFEEKKRSADEKKKKVGVLVTRMYNFSNSVHPKSFWWQERLCCSHKLQKAGSSRVNTRVYWRIHFKLTTNYNQAIRLSGEVVAFRALHSGQDRVNLA